MKTYLKNCIEAALTAIGIDPSAADIQFEKPKVADHGDLSTNVAMTLARVAKKNPRQIAQDILDALTVDDAKMMPIGMAPRISTKEKRSMWSG